MIGNDVIDLGFSARQSDWRRKGYLNKLFSKREQQLIQNAENPENTVWNLWSRKEAAYKIYNRKTGIRAYNPLYFECENAEESGVVSFGEAVVFTSTEITPDFIHTIAVDKPGDLRFVRIIDDSDLLRIDGLPFYCRDTRCFFASRSHHGRFVRNVALFDDGFNIDLSAERAMDRTFFSDFK